MTKAGEMFRVANYRARWILARGGPIWYSQPHSNSQHALGVISLNVCGPLTHWPSS